MTAYGLRIRDWSSDVCSSELVAVAVHVGAARGGRGRGDRGGRLRAQRDHHADRGQDVAERVFVGGGKAGVVEVDAIGQLGADANAARLVALDACHDLGGEVAVTDMPGGVDRTSVGKGQRVSVHGLLGRRLIQQTTRNISRNYVNHSISRKTNN